MKRLFAFLAVHQRVHQRVHLRVLLLVLMLLFTAACAHPRTEARALARLEAYAHAVDYDFRTPELIYAFMTEDFRARMSEEAFVEAFVKERSYPYITPLFFYDPVVTLDPDGKSGSCVYTQAARIIGMTYTVRIVYENGDWFIEDWEEFLDGSYLAKFEDIPYSLDWYYDISE